MDSSFILFVFFSFILIALFIFILLYIDQLQKIRRHFKWRHSIIYLLGSFSILVSLALSYFISRFFSVKLAIAVFILLNGTAVYLLRRANAILRRMKKKVKNQVKVPVKVERSYLNLSLNLNLSTLRKIIFSAGC